MCWFKDLEDLDKINVENFNNELNGFFILEKRAKNGYHVLPVDYEYFTDFPALRKFVKENWNLFTNHQGYVSFAIKKVGFSA